MVIYHNNKRKNLSYFPLFLLQFFIHTDLLVQVADYTTNKKRELRDRLLLHCERISSQILTNNTHSSSGFMLPTRLKPRMHSIGTRIRELPSFKSLSNRCVELSMRLSHAFFLKYNIAKKEQDERML